MRIVVSGDRNWTDKELIKKTLGQYTDLSLPSHRRPFVMLISGGNGYLEDGSACYNESELRKAVRGADALAFQVAEELGMSNFVIFADWLKFGKSAGPKRNTEMLEKTKPNKVIAFHDDLSKSKGTKDLVNKAGAKGIETEIITHDQLSI